MSSTQPAEFDNEKLALDNCEREPVHTPGRVQEGVAVIAFSLSDFEIVCHSDNCQRILGLTSEQLLGVVLREALVNRKMIHGIHGALAVPSIKTQREHIGRFIIESKAETEFEVAISIGGKLGILEFEPATGNAGRATSAVFQVRTMLSSLTMDGVESMFDSAVTALRRLTGFDRVMGYKFLPCGAGEVVAEHRSPGVAPYLGLRYPAYDIPPQVRKLMLRQPLRQIPDINDPHSLLISKSDAPIDISMCHSRGVSPIYVEYLNNMGVCATLNISIIVRGELWGLFSFHHYRPRQLTPETRLVCELFGQLFSMQVQQELEKEILTRRKRAASIRDALKNSTSDTLVETFENMWKDLAESLNSNGLSIVRSDSVRSYGETPVEDVVRSLVESNKDPLLVTDHVSSIVSNFADSDYGKSAGALVLQIGSADDMQAVFFRNEIIHEVRWAGEPVKQVEHGPNGPRLTPRGSFAEYSETVAGKSDPWTQSDISAATELQSVILDVVYRDATQRSEGWRKQKKYQDVLIAELNHRVKNILALVRSIARQTQDSSQSLENFATSFEKRISALATAHDLIGGSGVQWAGLKELVAAELKPFQNSPQASTEVSGPDIGLRADIAPVIALVIHELVSNATKHGALSEKNGRLKVVWSVDGGGLSIQWDETEIGKLSPPSERGFGLSLIERAVPFECKGEANINFHNDGLSVKLWIPSEAIQLLAGHKADDANKVQQQAESQVDSLGFELKSALVVEDNMILAMETEKALKNLGCEIIESAPSVETGLRKLEQFSDFALAILDINLGDSTSYELAQKIDEMNIPIIFVSGYDSKFDMPEKLRGFQHLNKPIEEAAFVKAIRIALGK